MSDTYPICVTVGEQQFFLTNEEMARMWDTFDGYSALTRWGYDPSRLVSLGLVEIQHREVGNSPAFLTDLGNAVVEARMEHVKRTLVALKECGWSATTCQRVHSSGEIALSAEQIEDILSALARASRIAR